MQKILLNKKLFEDFFASLQGRRIAYHYSRHELFPGQILDPKHIDFSYYKNRNYEKCMESIRQHVFPNLPSRLNCIYSSPYPKNKFSNFGYCYMVELIGKSHYADANIVDNLADIDYHGTKSCQDLARHIYPYWKGILSEKKDIEILSDKVKIIGLYKPDNFLVAGQKYQILNPMPVSIGAKDEIEKDGDKLLSFFTDVKKNDTGMYYGTIKPNTIIQITTYQRNRYAGDNPNAMAVELSFKINGFKWWGLCFESDLGKGGYTSIFSKDYFEKNLKKL